MTSTTRISKCKSCGALITWLRTKRDKRIPVDGATSDFLFEQKKHVSHWDTCPQANQWRGQAEPKQPVQPHVVPKAMQDRLIRVRTEARVLLKKCVSVEEIRQISSEVTGLDRFEHLHCTSQQTLDKLIQRLQERGNKLNPNILKGQENV